ncbi:MAG: LssY C-terminal domain-containing protein [Kiritimatiellae bacterium]|nr:LssY C-terminal domain-containing protein [Kiritimatiellia bacterium]
MLTGGCATSSLPRPIADTRWMQNAFSKTHDDLTVWIALPGDAQTKEHWGLPLQNANIQPVWIRVANRSTRPYWLLPAFIDPDYYSSAEVARRFRHMFISANERSRREIRVEEVAFDHYIPPLTDQSGFIYTVLSEGSRVFSVALLSTGSLQRFDFMIPTERLRTDHRRFDNSLQGVPESLAATNHNSLLDIAGLRSTLAAWPSNTTAAGSARPGDPINFFIVGSWNVLFPALITAGWDETETLDASTALHTTSAFVFGTTYRYSPVSPLFLLNRPQDAAFQKVRETIRARNHLRLWLTPLSFDGQQIWAGQISRDIGVHLTTRTAWLTTHEIDPDVDGARWSLVQDLIVAQCVARIGFIKGGTIATPLAPRRNLTGDPYFTDGLRVVLFLSSSPIGADEIQILPWSSPPRGGLSQPGDYLKSGDTD